MSEKIIRVCDGCGKTLERTAEAYHLDLKTEKYFNGVDDSQHFVKLDFCEMCAADIKEVLTKIAERLKGMKK